MADEVWPSLALMTLVFQHVADCDSSVDIVLRGRAVTMTEKHHHTLLPIEAIAAVIDETCHVILAVKLKADGMYLAIVQSCDKQRPDMVVVVKRDDELMPMKLILAMAILSTTGIEMQGAGIFCVTATNSQRLFFATTPMNETWAVVVELRRRREIAPNPQSLHKMKVLWALPNNGTIDDNTVCWIEPNAAAEFTYEKMMPALEQDVAHPKLYSKPSPDVVKQVVLDFVSGFADPEELDTKTIWNHLIEKFGDLIANPKQGYSKEFVNEALFFALGQMIPASCILQDQLWLGSRHNAANLTELKRLGVTHIINVTVQVPKFYPENFIYTQINVLDVPEANLYQFLERACDFIDDALQKKKRVFVHCQEGVSRSASVVIAYVMRSRHMSFVDALSLVKSQRRIVNPNVGFREQLKRWEGRHGVL